MHSAIFCSFHYLNKIFNLYFKLSKLFSKILSPFAIALLLFATSCKSEAEKIVDETVSKNKVIDSTLFAFQKKFLTDKIDSVFTKYNFNGAVLITKNDTLLYERYNGFEDFGKEKKLTNQSVFAIASISKQFTAVLILLLEEKGLLSTDDFVSKYLKALETKEFKNITIKQLLNHTSGISDLGNGLMSKPGEKFNYSNKGYRLLGEIIEKVSGKSYDENAMELFQKVGMKHTFTANDTVENLSGAYLGNASKFQKIENMPKRLAQPSIGIPAGGILSTTRDLNLWNQKLYSGQILNPQTFIKFTEKSADRKHQIFGSMGYGFGIMMTLENPNSFYHSGYVKGSPALNIFYPTTKTSIIILSNIADESQGKKAIFNPHKDIKTITDSLQIETIKLKQQLKLNK